MLTIVPTITRIEPLTEDRLIRRFRETRLRGHGRPLVYENATVRLMRRVDPGTLYPAQNYVLRANIRRLHALHEALQARGYDIWALEGAIFFWMQEGEGPEEGPIPLTPPVVEMSREPDGRVVPLINDGMHRVYAAMQARVLIHVVHVEGVPERWPYYAYARPEGWRGVEERDALPDNYVKKAYRDPDRYKALFRDFNGVFPGIQAQRKRSNPAHLRA